MQYIKMSALSRFRPGLSFNNLFALTQVSQHRCNSKNTDQHPETPKYGEYDNPPKKGAIYDKKPFPIELEAGKKYSWCTCGWSKSQPFCDGSHKEILRMTNPRAKVVNFKPTRFEVTESKKYWLCMCKQTNNRPFCDGSHLSEEVQKKMTYS
ncbi:uncharacterized protein LOC143062862 [Mytilus galloprovincialis]|uniref:uncharacterized protein LOC143062862 n=1 Tax=Mytilus galloprovincialis TaxID=29158 RepID=UPI003F7C16CA